MELNDLNIFQTIASEGTFSGAARKLDYAQSNISMRVKILEDELNAILFKRNGRGSVLTLDGEKLLNSVIQINSIVQDIQDDFGISDNASTLKIGAPQTILASIVPGLILTFKNQFPQCNFELISISSSQGTEPLLSNQIDLGLLYEVHSKDIEIMTELYENAVMISAKSDDCAEISDLPLLVNSDPNCPYRKIAYLWAENHKWAANHILYFDTLESIINSVKQGFGVSVIPESLCATHTDLTVHPIENLDTQIPIKVCIKRTSKNHTLQKKFAHSI